MRTHGPKTPNTIRGLRQRRTLPGMLDAKATHDADLSQGEIVSAFGNQFSSVVVPGNSTPFIVANQTGGRTSAPGSKVILASFRGKPGQAVLGGSPGGKGGGRTTTRNRRPRGSSAAAEESNQYAFGYDGLGAMVATLYNDGTYISTRATDTSVGDFTGCILSDESLLVGDGSALMRDGDTLYVWDVEGAATHSYAVPGGWTGATRLYYQNGFLYWCGMESVTGQATFDVRLRKSDTDLGNVSTISTFTSPDASVDYGGPPWTQWQEQAQALTFAVDSDGAVLYVDSKIWDEADANQWHGLQIRFALAGSNAFREFTSPELGVDGTNRLNPPTDFPCATLATTFAICEPIDTVQSVLSKDDDSSTTASNLWDASDLDGRSTSSFNVGTGGSNLQVYSASTGEIIRGIASGLVVTSAIDAFDETPNYPSALFFYGV